MSLGQFMIKTYLKGNLITARDGGGHNRDALVTSATTVGPNEIFQLETEQPDFIIFTTPGGDWVTAVDGGGATAAVAAFDTTGMNLTDFVLFRIDGPRGNGVYTIGTWRENFVTALGGGGKSTEAFHTNARCADATFTFTFDFTDFSRLRTSTCSQPRERRANRPQDQVPERAGRRGSRTGVTA